MKLKVENSKIGGTSLLTIMIIIDLVFVTSLDLYIPALPQIRDEFAVSESYLNLTIFLFMMCAAIVILAVAPIADKIGRRPSVIFASVFFTIGSIIGSLAPNTEILIVARIFQACGMGSVFALFSTIIQEGFAEESRKLAMTIIQSLVLVGPFVAPFLGTFILSVSNWRTIFTVLALCGAICILLSLLVPETKPKEIQKAKIGASVKCLLSDRKFVCLTLILAILALPVFAFIGVFSYVCLEFFNGDFLQYNILYSAVTVIAILSPFIYAWLSKRLSNLTIYIISLALLLLAAILIPLVGYISIFVFVAAYAPAEITEGIVRPHSFLILLDQKKENVATASSITNFAYNSITAFGSVFATLPIWSDYIQAIGVITACSFIVSAALLVVGYARFRPNCQGHNPLK